MSETVIAYYDAESIEHISDGHVRVWTKTISLSEVERIMKLGGVSDKAERKIKAGYGPPYILSNPEPKSSFENNMKIIVWEEAANYDVIKSRMKAFYELNCKNNKIRNLSITNYKNGGGPETSSKIGNWTSISPKSNAETLHTMLCRQRDLNK